MRNVGKVKDADQDRPANMTKAVRNPLGRDIFNKIKKSRMRFCQQSRHSPIMRFRKTKDKNLAPSGNTLSSLFRHQSKLKSGSQNIISPPNLKQSSGHKMEKED